MRRVLKGAAAIIGGAIIAILAFLLGGQKARTRGEDDLQKEEAAAKAAHDKVLAADPRDVLAGLEADTRARIGRAGEEGITAGVGAAREALHRRRGAGGCPGGG